MQKDQKLTHFYKLLYPRWFSQFPECLRYWGPTGKPLCKNVHQDDDSGDANSDKISPLALTPEQEAELEGANEIRWKKLREWFWNNAKSKTTPGTTSTGKALAQLLGQCARGVRDLKEIEVYSKSHYKTKIQPLVEDNVHEKGPHVRRGYHDSKYLVPFEKHLRSVFGHQVFGHQVSESSESSSSANLSPPATSELTLPNTQNDSGPKVPGMHIFPHDSVMDPNVPVSDADIDAFISSLHPLVADGLNGSPMRAAPPFTSPPPAIAESLIEPPLQGLDSLISVFTPPCILDSSIGVVTLNLVLSSPSSAPALLTDTTSKLIPTAPDTLLSAASVPPGSSAPGRCSAHMTQPSTRVQDANKIGDDAKSSHFQMQVQRRGGSNHWEKLM
ncbi:hypothetical protein EDB19DRAFT_1833505 [Suillus lakei]|nr:hypothetical protein EDB19DRAFT_1833505 [Suillus lakei]